MDAPSATTTESATDRMGRIDATASPRRRLAIADYVRFRREGYLVARGVCPMEDVERLRAHGDALLSGTLEQHPPDQRWFPMLHRRFALHEAIALLPGMLDIVAGLVGPDVMLLQTMTFLKPPGERGNGWHQDSWYLQTFPDSLLGVWLALDRCDAENGALVIAVGSHLEPVYSHDRQPHPDRDLAGMRPMDHLHDPIDAHNELVAIAQGYPQVVVDAEPGDVVFLHGHVLHTSLPNVSLTRRRRAFVAHYANARAFTAWGSQYPAGHPQHAEGDPAQGGMTNGAHILARGTTHLPCARPRFHAG